MAPEKTTKAEKPKEQGAQLPHYQTIPNMRWTDEHGRLYQLDPIGYGRYELRIVGA